MLLDNIDCVAGFFAGRKLLNNNRRAASNFPCNILSIISAKTNPLPQFFSTGDLNQWDFILLAKGGDKLLVLVLLAVLGEDAEVGFLVVGVGGLEGFANFVKTLGELVLETGEF